MALIVRRSRPRWAIVALASIVAASVMVTWGSIGPASSSPASGWRSYVSESYGFSLGLAPGWRRARARLVPKLLDPREILSVGTAPMPVGGGGNCGRDPIAAIERMKRGDALISIQEEALDSALRSRLRRNVQSRPSSFGGDRLYSQDQERNLGYSDANLSFRDHGRVFAALVYLKGRPSRTLREQIVAILDGLRFRAGAWVRFPGESTRGGGGRVS